jgi:hypothetical protein
MKKPSLKKLKLRHITSRKKEPLQPVAEAVPRITTHTIAEHREEVIGSARKYIYPLEHSKHKILLISTTVLIVGTISFFIYCTLSLYKFGGRSTFLYRVTQVIPFPVAKAGSHYVNYENYLFELRHYTHYYQSQLQLDFNSPEGKQQLEAFRKQALDKVVNDSFIKELADKYKITVSNQEINDQITVVRSQNRLGTNDSVLEDVLRNYWGWTLDDFKRSLKSQLLAQKVVAALDTETTQRAEQALNELNSGANFADVAKKYSDDIATKNNSGDIGVIDKSNRDVSAQTVNALYATQPGSYSGITQVGYSLEIVKNIETTKDGKVHGAHILFNLKDISVYLNDLKEKEKATLLIKV